MTEVRHHRSRQLHRPTLRAADRELLELPEAQPIIKRLGEAVSEYCTVDRDTYILRLAVTVIRAKLYPRSPYARPTLALSERGEDGTEAGLTARGRADVSSGTGEPPRSLNANKSIDRTAGPRLGATEPGGAEGGPF